MGIDYRQGQGTHMQKQQIEQKKMELISRYGEWTVTAVHLGHGVWTQSKHDTPPKRTRRFVQIVEDLVGKEIANCRILDLACLEGEYSIEFGMRGARVLGIEGRETNIEKAKFSSEVLDLKNVEFKKDDVRNISVEKYGKFDVIICSGILYHLPADDVCPFIYKIHDMAERLVILDTHISLSPTMTISYRGEQYQGHTYTEHSPDDSPETKLERKWASLDNDESFWFTRASLFNLLSNVGFTSFYECFSPQHQLPKDRCVFVAIKGRPIDLMIFPGPDHSQDNWEEETFLVNDTDSDEIRKRLERLNRLENHPLIRLGLKLCRSKKVKP